MIEYAGMKLPDGETHLLDWMRIDGRLREDTAREVCREEAVNRPWDGMTYPAYQLRRGDRVSTARTVSPVLFTETAEPVPSERIREW